MSTILIIDATLPTYDQDSGSLRLFNLIKMLVKLGYKVTFFPDTIHQSHFKYKYVLETTLNIEVFSGEISDVLSARTFAFVWICRVWVAHRYIPFLRLLSPHTKIFYDTVDIHYLRELRQAKIEDNPRLAEQAFRTKRQELSNCLLADGVITVTEADGHHLQKELPQLTFSVIPNIHQYQPSSPDFEQRDSLVFIGHYRHKPNEDAVCYFVETVLPKIHAQLPNIKLYLIGSQMTEKILALESIFVKIIGWVDKVEPELAQRRVFVSYLRYGAGMKGKIGQALLLGLPVVTTTIGAEGMGLIDGKTALLADEPERFANAVCRLYQDSVLWEKLSRQGQDYIEQQCGETVVFNKLRCLLANYKVLPNVASAFLSLVQSQSFKNSSHSPNINK